MQSEIKKKWIKKLKRTSKHRDTIVSLNGVIKMKMNVGQKVKQHRNCMVNAIYSDTYVYYGRMNLCCAHVNVNVNVKSWMQMRIRKIVKVHFDAMCEMWISMQYIFVVIIYWTDAAHSTFAIRIKSFILINVQLHYANAKQNRIKGENAWLFHANEDGDGKCRKKNTGKLIHLPQMDMSVSFSFSLLPHSIRWTDTKTKLKSNTEQI